MAVSPQWLAVSFYFLMHSLVWEHVYFACTARECASVNSGNSLIPKMARIGEWLQLHGRLVDCLPSLHLNDGPINVLLQVDKSPVVAHRLPGRDVWVLHEVGLSDSVCAHDVVHMHADSVADSGRQGGCRGGVGLMLARWIRIFGKLEDDT